MCHKLLYVKFGILDWFRCHMGKKNPSSINKRIDYIFEVYNRIPLIVCPYFSLILTGWCSKLPIIVKASKTGP